MEQPAAYLRPVGQQFRHFIVEHADGAVVHYPQLWPSGAEMVALRDIDLAHTEAIGDILIWVWAVHLGEGRAPGSPVVRIVDEWTGPALERPDPRCRGPQRVTL